MAFLVSRSKPEHMKYHSLMKRDYKSYFERLAIQLKNNNYDNEHVVSLANLCSKGNQ